MHIHFTFGLNQPASGDGLGLKTFGELLQTTFPNKFSVGYSAYNGDVLGDIKSQWDGKEPLITVAHSFGGGDNVNIATSSGIAIDSMFLLDPVQPNGWGFLNFTDFIIPANVSNAWCWKRSAFSPPFFVVWSSPIRNPSDKYLNFTVNEDHNSIPADPSIHEVIMNRIELLLS